uniref:Guanine nucleotide-binding protein-like 1 n=1 Tax=Peronospora matthiolae TaxID=2874970 RepID=A0AAV1THL7_9STRA
MPPRKKPFSGKAKKQQLRDARTRKRDARDSDEDAKELTQEETAAAAAVSPAPPVICGRGDLRTVFQKEPQAAVDARKQDATRELVYADDRGNSQSIYKYGIQDPANQPHILTKPEWSRDMTPEELNEVDRRAFTEWVEYLEKETMSRGEETQINLYERNLEVWRQLWRVVERSSILVHLADARCPLLHISDQLMTHIRTKFPWKRVVLVLTKTDLVAAERVEMWSRYLQARYGQDIPVLAYCRDTMEESNSALMRAIGQVSAGVELHIGTEDFNEDRDKDTLTIGFVGEPNVGKSSLLNSLFERKLVSVSATPGHTKYLQTHYFDRVEMLERGDDAFSRILMFDCPGVVFPRFNVPVLLQVLFGSFPIAQTREPFSAMRFIAENCALHLHEVYKLKPVEKDDDEEWSPYSLCESYAQLRSFRMKGGKLDVHRAANFLLRDTLNGKKVVLSFPPPADTELVPVSC